MVRLILVDWRRLAATHLIGSMVFVTVLPFIWRDFTQASAAGFAPDAGRATRTAVHLMMTMILAQAPLLFWSQLFMFRDYSRQKLIDVLPLAQRALSLVRLLQALLLFAMALPSWVLVFLVWRHFASAIPYWLPVLVGILLLDYVLITMLCGAPYWFLPLLFAATTLAQSGYLFTLPLEPMTSPWTSLIFAFFTVPLIFLALMIPPPRRTRC